MKIFAINGGPRKTWNTASMLKSFLDGAESVGPHIKTEMVHLFDLNYKGCVSCFACKRGGPSYGKCAIRDDIHELLQKIPASDGVVFGSPIYFHDITAQLRGFFERLFFQYHSFEKGEHSLAPRSLRSAMIYTMNVTEEQMRRDKYDGNLAATEGYLEYTFHSGPELIYAFNTYEFKNYADYKASYWNEREKAEYRDRQFPIDLQRAFNAGVKMAEGRGL